MNTIVVNLFGEPSAGKSTAAMDITAGLKRSGINAEYVSEFAKDKVYEHNEEVFAHQEYLFGKQSFKMGRVNGQVQVIVTDSPLLFNILYNNDDKILGEDFNRVAARMFNSYNNRNYVLTRYHKYENEGRRQDEKEATEVRHELLDLLHSLNVPYEYCTSSEEDCTEIVNKIVKEIKGDEQ